MEIDLQVIDEEGTEHTIQGIVHERWGGLDDPCPECGAKEFRHFTTNGGRFGRYKESVVERSDYWFAKRPLHTRCLNCKVTLYQHPAFELLFDLEGDNEAVINL